MKKVLLLVALLLLSACETPSLDIRQELRTTLNQQQSFTVEESFRWRRFATLSNAPWNEFVEIENSIDFQNNRYFVEHLIDEETNVNRVVERTLFQAASYKNIYSRDAAIRVNRQWYNVELPLVNSIGLGSLDPVFVVTELLYNNIELYYKSDAGVTGDISSFRIAVVTISDTLFERLFEHTVGSYIEIPYSYTVTAEIRFNDNYEVTEIVFDLNRLIRQYRDYYTVQQGAVFNSLIGQYSLLYHSYNQVVVLDLPVGISFQPSNQSIASIATAETDSQILQPTLITVPSTTPRRSVQLEVAFQGQARIALVELIGLSNGERTLFVQRQMIGLQPNERLLLERIENANALTELYVSIRYLDQQRSVVVFETLNLTPRLRAQ
jgi:hypothetical protein